MSILDTVLTGIGKGVSAVTGLLGFIPGMSTAGAMVSTILSEFTDIMTESANYKDGISETSFGSDMEKSWSTFKQSHKDFITETPLNSNEITKVYGNRILGTPPFFTDMADPAGRAMSNTFMKDFRFLTLTPGMPQFNGGFTEQFNNDANNTFKTQTKDYDSMKKYLLDNGISSDFASKDRRYYTFQSKFDEYYSYLETMLNTVWMKLGLSNEGKDIFSFFGKNGNSLDLELKSLGFFINNIPQVSESISNSELTNNIQDSVNEASREFQNINYMTGMGTATGKLARDKKMARAVQNFSSQLGTVTNTVLPALSSAGSLVTNTVGAARNLFSMNWSGLGNNIGGLVGGISGLANSVVANDISAVMQQLRATNGMQVVYPNLWSTSAYSKNINMDFTFTSPYGDPLSIFHYVFVPFFALLTFALPRQADENGFVSPFFVRADVPGHFVSDFAFISDMNWQRGGQSGNLFTKDGLPRSIHVSITISDLFPYLAMTKRLSFLSANPSFTMFLDSFTGLHVTKTADDNNLDSYFKDVLQRVSAEVPASNRRKNSYGADVFKNARNSSYLKTNGKKTTTNSINHFFKI